MSHTKTKLTPLGSTRTGIWTVESVPLECVGGVVADGLCGGLPACARAPARTFRAPRDPAGRCRGADALLDSLVIRLRDGERRKYTENGFYVSRTSARSRSAGS
ncbi:hypothetical protein EVAR_27759_1 [Eumeta japonica]|uniref:Uncharacterized protein n=1 Tax=Eumeta variegata TaxID=151549 RepID=A0A4C1VB59_EUMVA|nr:hypothetical protein EVAR_27759_1 [Eumeta japonica]